MRCPSCPLAGTARPCLGVQHPRYCELAQQDWARLVRDPEYCPYWLEFLGGKEAPCVGRRTRVRSDRAPTVVPASAVTRTVVATPPSDDRVVKIWSQHKSIWGLVLACPHRDFPPGCGCGAMGRCRVDNGPDPAHPGRVNNSDCFRCQDDGGPEVDGGSTPGGEGGGADPDAPG
jgi:hypothetical protein